MRAGTLRHEEKTSHYPTLDDYGWNDFLNDFLDGKQIVVKEASLCSRFYGFRCHVDLLEITPDWKREMLTLHVHEYKSGFNKYDIFQLISEAVLLSNAEAEFVFNVQNKRGKTVQVGKKLYTYAPPFKLNIITSLQIFGDEAFSKPFMFDNQMTKWGASMSGAVQRRAKSFRRYHKRSIYFIAEIPMCRNCKHDDGKCSYWGTICSNYQTEDDAKIRQMFFGKRKLLIKTKPQIPKIP